MANNILGLDIDQIIRSVLKESFPANEKKAQDKKSKQLKQFKSGSQSEVDEAEDESSDQVKAADIIELFNTMRSGHSLKDEKVRKDFQTYFDSLSGSERVAFLAFSKATADIIAGENSKTDTENQPQPEDYGVEVSKDQVSQAKSSSSKDKKNKAKKDDSSTPIVVGESANKSRELKILRRYQ